MEEGALVDQGTLSAQKVDSETNFWAPGDGSVVGRGGESWAAGTKSPGPGRPGWGLGGHPKSWRSFPEGIEQGSDRI